MSGEALKRIVADDFAGAREADLYAPLIGSWSITSTWHDAEGGERCGRGEWHFDRILGGLGVQDVLFSEGAAPRECRTSVRAYDEGANVWRIVWMQPSSGEFVVLEGRSEGDEIVQEGTALDGEPGRLERWRFVDITDSSFTWLGESSSDGDTWRVEQRMDARRM